MELGTSMPSALAAFSFLRAELPEDQGKKLSGTTTPAVTEVTRAETVRTSAPVVESLRINVTMLPAVLA
jgi:hypothetical protein